MNMPITVHAGDPATDSRGFRQCLGQFSTGVTIIAAEKDGKRVGVTANSFSSLSLDPPLILWSIARTSRAFPIMSTAEHFAVSILAEDQVHVSQRFASKEDDKFATIDWYPGKNGAPVIAGAAARLECKTEAVQDGGDHLLIIGRVTNFEREERRSLVFSQGRYSTATDHPSMRTDAPPTSVSTASSEQTLGSLVFKAHITSAKSFDEGRAALGLSIGQARVLYVLSDHAALSINQLVKNANLPLQTVEDALFDLSGQDAVRRNLDGSVSLTESGQALRATVRARSHDREVEIVRHIAPDRLAVAKQVLEQFISQEASPQRAR